MDSRVSRIQMWREQKKKERQEKRRAHYEKNREEIIEKVVEARKKSREAKSGQLRYVPIKDATKKRRRERHQQKLASENKGKLEREKDAVFMHFFTKKRRGRIASWVIENELKMHLN